MTVIALLILLSIVIAGAFLGGFIWAVRSGQYEDTCTPAMRILWEENKRKPAPDVAARQLGPERSPSTKESGV